LREWKLRCPKGEHGKLEFVFPTGTGEIEYHSNIAQRGLAPALIAAGIVTKDGKPKYPAYIRCATSTRRGASIALKMAV